MRFEQGNVRIVYRGRADSVTVIIAESGVSEPSNSGRFCYVHFLLMLIWERHESIFFQLSQITGKTRISCLGSLEITIVYTWGRQPFGESTPESYAVSPRRAMI